MFRLFTFNSYFRPRTTPSLPPRSRAVATVGIVVAAVGSAVAAFSPAISLDAPVDNNIVKDPATDIEFPKTLRVPSKFPLPTYTLVGVGVRKVESSLLPLYAF